MNTKIKVCNVEITHPDKVLFSKSKTSKIELVNYYKKASKFMLKFLDKRLLTELRCHDKNQKSCFYKKHSESGENVEKFYVSKLKTAENEYFYVKNVSQLIGQVQLGTIEFHIWGSKIDNINKPDIMVFDFDPDEKLSIDKLRQEVKHLKQILDSLNLKSFLKTSGGKGYHICVPFSPSVSWQKFSNFAKKVADLMEQNYPSCTTTISKKDRKGKVFIDYLRNKKGATCVCPYSVRSKQDATISLPIFWEQLDTILPNEITVKNISDELLNQNPWKNFFKTKQTLK